jgi:hypothetical protein
MSAKRDMIRRKLMNRLDELRKEIRQARKDFNLEIACGNYCRIRRTEDKYIRLRNKLKAEKINVKIAKLEQTGDISDGYHTFDELYEHRIELYIALCKTQKEVWRSKLHSDGSYFNGWFILGINKEKGKQITYHLPISKWNNCDFAETLNIAPKWDGHTSNDVLNRLQFLV